ncbi:MAG TPA: DNA-processing protein DprA [Methylophilaceae bacterium]|nr:DNA-processing protein DprA [Methylophilaceae bacterium]
MASTASNSLDENDLALWICLNQIHGLGAQSFCKLLQAFDSPEQIFATSYNQLITVVAEPIAKQISAGPDFDSTSSTLNWLENADNHLITLANKDYPRALLEISDPPPLLFAKGHLHWLNTPAISVVGSRNASHQGEKNAEDFSQALCQQGYTIVSGMALGIDGAAHRGALKANGATIAVVGTGLDIVYPARHRELAHQIVERGLIISEFGLGTPSRAQNFPRRNRIISGLGLGCLVVEANVQSGSLITAKLAAEQGREVFAIPGSIHSPMSKGCHELIKQGAKLVDNIKDILDELGSISSDSYAESTMPTSQVANASQADPILACIGYDPISMESLVERSGLTSEHLSAMLLMLELENKVASLPGGRYQRIA